LKSITQDGAGTTALRSGRNQVIRPSKKKDTKMPFLTTAWPYLCQRRSQALSTMLIEPMLITKSKNIAKLLRTATRLMILTKIMQSNIGEWQTVYLRLGNTRELCR